MTHLHSGFFRCYTCFMVIFVTIDDVSDNPKRFRWDQERGDLYVNDCKGCQHWRYYEPLATRNGDLR